jgi:uncharacterized protein YbcV (DUF1398 family)
MGLPKQLASNGGWQGLRRSPQIRQVSASPVTSLIFTIEQIDDLHARLGSAKTFPEYVLALKGLGVQRYDSYLADGHSEYFGQGGHRVFSQPAHEELVVAETGQRDTFLQHLRRHELHETTYSEMSRGLAQRRDREVDLGHREDDYDVLRQGKQRDARRADHLGLLS